MTQNENPEILMLKILAACVTASREAGNVIRNVLKKGNMDIVEKGLNDYQTEADRSAQRWIFNYMKYKFPDINIVGEEDIDEILQNFSNCNIDQDYEHMKKLSCPQDFVSAKLEDIVIWVDPLDGTSEFTEGHLDHVTVLIGIAYKGKAIGGAICQPFYNENAEKELLNCCDETKNMKDSNFCLQKELKGRIIWGLVGLGVWGLNVKDPPKDKFIICTTQSHNSEVVMEANRALKPDEILRVGGCGMKVLLVMEGKVHAYVYASKGSKKWDTCAPEGLLRALGGSLTSVLGEHIDYTFTHGDQCHNQDGRQNHAFNNYYGILATGKAIDHEALVRKIPESVKRALTSATPLP